MIRRLRHFRSYIILKVVTIRYLALETLQFSLHGHALSDHHTVVSLSVASAWYY